jgi:protein-S-isoprenylcysteine O-methyltransferase Ste14
MSRGATLLFAILAYGLFFATFLYLICFVGNAGFAPVTVDKGPIGPVAVAVVVDLALIALFGLQHSVMARPAFKRWFTRFIPASIERSTYVLLASLVLFLLYWQWRPIGGVVWDVTHPAGRTLLHALFAVGWLMVPAVSLMINHFDLFGTRQVWLHLKGREYENLPFRTPMAYRFVRHPLYVGWMIAFWATPTMTAAHLLFAAGLTAYIFIAIPFEERNLVEHFGGDYRAYRGRVGGLIPRTSAAGRQAEAPAEPILHAAQEL